MTDPTTVTVLGPGGVGGYLAARLAARGDAVVQLVARGEHLAAIRAHGLRLRSPEGDVDAAVAAAEDPAELAPPDLVLLTTKARDVEGAARAVLPTLPEHATVVTFQNGVESPDVAAAVVGAERVVAGVAYIFASISSPGTVTHRAAAPRFVIGERSGPATARTRAVHALLQAAVPGVELVDDVQQVLWRKFATICPVAGLTATTRLPVDALRDVPATRALFVALAAEVVAVARARGVALPDDTVDGVMAFIDGLGEQAHSSLSVDLVNGNPMELDALHGSLVRLAADVGVDVPTTRVVHGLLAPWADLNRGPAATRARLELRPS